MQFRSVDPSRNRNRRYGVVAQYHLDGHGGELVITWGRAGARYRQRVETFDSLENLQKRYATLVARRRRHGYELVQEISSSAVASSSTLTVDSSSRFIAMLQKNGYLGLFDTRQHTFVIRDVAPDVDPDALQELAATVASAAEHVGDFNTALNIIATARAA